jgi:predicted esterase
MATAYKLHKPDASTKVGIGLETLTPSVTKVVKTTPGGLAAAAGVPVGAEVISINGVKVTDMEQGAGLIKSAVGDVEILVTSVKPKDQAEGLPPAAEPTHTVLYLHGYGENGLIASYATLGLTAALAPRGFAIDSQLEGYIKLESDEDLDPIIDKEYMEMCKSGEFEAYAWSRFIKVTPEEEEEEAAPSGGGGGFGGVRRGHRIPSAPDFEHLDDPQTQSLAVEKLAEHINKLGGVDGLVGFSQGGAIACLLAEAAGERLSASAQQRLRCIGVFGSEDPFTKRGVPPRGGAVLASLRFFVCFGERDDEARYDSETLGGGLAAAGVKEVRTCRVPELDHHMPPEGDSAYEELLAVLERAVRPVRDPAEKGEGGGFGESAAGKTAEAAAPLKALASASAPPPPSPAPIAPSCRRRVHRFTKPDVTAKAGLVLAHVQGPHPAVVVDEVRPGGLAAGAGLAAGQLVRSVNGVAATDYMLALEALRRAEGCVEVEVEVVEDDRARASM